MLKWGRAKKNLDRAVSFTYQAPLPGGVPEWPKGTDCKSVVERLRRFESSPLHQPTTTRFRAGFFVCAPRNDLRPEARAGMVGGIRIPTYARCEDVACGLRPVVCITCGKFSASCRLTASVTASAALQSISIISRQGLLAHNPTRSSKTPRNDAARNAS